MADPVNFVTPVGRLVGGSLYEARTMDEKGVPYTVKTGPNAGQPSQRYYFALAVPKRPNESHWSQTPWGAKIWAAGHAANPAAAQSPHFAWKVEDGDSAVPNKKGVANRSREGYPGHWILKFQGTMAPRVCNANGTQEIREPNAVKTGWYVQVAGSTGSNGRTDSPGVYMNYQFVALAGYGPEIVFGPDPSSLGFGQEPLPPGASAVPPAAVSAPPAAPPAYAPPAAPPAYAPPAAPHTQWVQNAAGALPASQPGAGLLPTMTAKAGGMTRDAFAAKGWTDKMLVEHGYMIEDNIPF